MVGESDRVIGEKIAVLDEMFEVLKGTQGWRVCLVCTIADIISDRST